MCHINYSEFVKRYFQEGKYRQNRPLTAKNFIDYCKTCGISTSLDELELLEKNKLFFPIFRIERPICEEGNQKYYSDYSFDEFGSDLLINWIENKLIYSPQSHNFKSWDNFYGPDLSNGNEKIVSYYSSFQIYILYKIKEQVIKRIDLLFKNIDLGPFTITLIDRKPNIEYNLSIKYQWDKKDEFHYSFNEIRKWSKSYELIAQILKKEYSFGIRKQRTQIEIEKFEKFLYFMLDIQNIFFPYTKSNNRKFSISGTIKEWNKDRHDFNASNVLKIHDIKIDFVIDWYIKLSWESCSILGSYSHDWPQLWKNIKWGKKKELKGEIRRGLELFGWANMLRKFLVEYYGQDILDIDEVQAISTSAFLKIVNDGQKITTTRDFRLKRYNDEVKGINYYNDKYKRLFYLANDFGIEYQPRIILFVEGIIETIVIPKLYEWYTGDTLENIGIEIVCFEGVDKLLSTSETARKLRNLIIDLQREEKEAILSKTKHGNLNEIIRKLENIDIIISNWTSFINYNLEKWQMIPYFLSDNEGNVKRFLTTEKPIRYCGENYNVPSKWQFLWGINNENQPFKGDSFELANYSNEELALVISEILDKKINEKNIEELRENNSSINKIDAKIEENKKEINNKLVEELLKKEDKNILQRPIFNVFNQVRELAIFNHPPSNTRTEVSNREYILELLNENQK